MRISSLLARLALALTLLAGPALAQEGDGELSLLEEAAQATSDQDFITRLITGALSDTGRSVVIEGFEGALSSRATIERIIISDAEGVWLIISGVVLDWNRSALFQRRIEIGEMSAESIRFVRTPEPSTSAPSPEAKPFRLPDLPVAVEVEQLQVDTVVLGEAILGQRSSFSLDGGLSFDDGALEARIEADRLDAEGGFVIAGSYSNESRMLDLDVALREGPGGIVASLLDIPGEPALSLELAGSGPIDDFSAELALATDGTERVTGTFGLVTVDGASQVRADISGDVTPLLPADYEPFFGDSSRIAFQGRREADGALILDRLEAQAETLQLAASGELQPDGWPVRLELDGTFGTGTGNLLVLPFGGGNISARSAEIALDYDQAEDDGFTLTFTADEYVQGDVEVGALRLEGTGTISPDAETFTADLAYNATGLDFSDEALLEAVGTDISGQITVAQPAEGPLEISQLTLEGPGLEIAGSATVDTASERLQSRLDFDLTAGDLSRFAELAGTDLTGAANVAIGADIALLDRAGRVTIEGETTDLGFGIDELDGLLAGDGRLSLTAARDAEGTRIEALEVRTDGLTLVADANVSSAQATADFSLTLPQLSRVVPDLTGPGTFNGTARWGAASGATIDATLAADQLMADVDVVLSPQEGWSGTVTADVGDLAPFSSLAGRDLGGAANLEITGTASEDFSRFDVQVDGSTQDLAVGVDAADALLAGTGRISASVSGIEDAITFENVSAETPQLSLQTSGSLEGQDLQATFDASLTDLGLVAPGYDGPATATGRALIEGDAVDVTATISAPGGLGADISVQGPGNGAPLEVNAELAVPDLAPFSELAGRPLSGSAELSVTGTASRDLSRYDLAIDGTTQDLALGIDAADTLLAGTGEISAQVTGADGTITFEDVSAETPQLSLAASGTLAGETIDATFDASLTNLGLIAPGYDGPASASGRASISGEAIDLTATIAAPQGLGADIAVQSPGADAPLSIDAELTVPDLAPFSELAGRDLGGSVDLSVTGTASRDYTSYDLALDGTTQDLAVGIEAIEPLLAGSGAISGRVIGEDGALSFDGISAQTPQLSLAASGTLDGSDVDATFEASVTDLGLVAPGYDGPASASGRAVIAGDAVDITATVAAPDGLDIDVSLQSEGDGAPVDVDADLAIPDLAPFSDLAGRELGGSVALSVTGTTSADFASYDLTIDGTTQDLAVGIEAIQPLLDGEGRLSGRVASTAEGLTFEGISARTPQLSVETSGTLAGETLQATFDASVANLGLIAPGYDGRLTATGRAMVDGGAVDVAASVSAPNGLSAEVTVLRDDASAPLTLDASATIPDLAPFSELAGLPLDGSVDLQANGTIPAGGARLEIDVTGTTEDIAIGVPQVDALLAGTGSLSATLVSDDGLLAAEDLSIATPAITLTGRAERAADGALWADLDTTILQPGALVSGLGQPIDASLDVTLAADRALDAALTATTGPNSISLTATGPWSEVEEDWLLETSATIEAPQLSALAGPVGVPLSGGLSGTAEGTLRPMALAFGQEIRATTQNLGVGNDIANRLLAGRGTIYLDIQRAEDGSLSSDAFSLDFPNLQAGGALARPEDGGQADFTARLADIGLIAPGFSGPLRADGTASLNGGAWQLSADLDGPGGLGARVSGSYGPGGALDIGATGQLPLGLVNGFLEPRRLDGTASFDLSLTGPSLSALSGTVSLADARLSLPTFTLAIEGLSGTVTLGGGTADVALSGGISSGGTLSVTGSVGLTDGFNAALRANADGLILRDPALYEATVDAAIAIDGPLTGGARISGEANLREAEIRVPSSPIGPLGDLPTVYHIEPSPAVRTTLNRAELTIAGEEVGADGGTEGPGVAYALDLTLNAPGRIFVRGRGLDAELGGQLQITGTTANIIPTGAFNLIRGRLDLLGQRFELDEGSVTLQGNFDPYLRLVARTEAPNGTVVIITVEGPAMEPEVTFSSEPSLPEDEVLSQLLFGTSISDISPLQAVQLASAVSTLAGRGGVGVLGRLRQGLGLDDLDVQTDEEGNTAVRAGRYLSENVYADVTLGDESEVTLNLDVTDNVTVRGSVTSEGESRLGLFYELDY
ncbi:translocation/assembly module TamB domain-containing protein [Pseudoroseicyclus tamaricis]|uniref:Translocation and assembly module TamB C-terminal domain-containing protein n=1 Tax=Pseudoroseicyclus tamaricis TaxID=2705421 RepID=A0A6B2JFW6_9RHOB|nr:translocation/assembly module TamB domain-containing protein [Pseudoroseicyclus tamaricis]NDU99990.1 hypothetical protein [Pseudoroseicyclus tamaricis]